MAFRSGIRWLVSINVLWLVQISLPLLDARVPSVFSVPFSELLSLPLGALLVLCADSLLSLTSCSADGGCERSLHLQDRVKRLSSGDSENKPQTTKHGVVPGWRHRLMRVLFLVLASTWTAGVGMHLSAVVVQIQLTSEDPLYPLVHDHLHRLWSHNIFQSGYFGLLLLLSWSTRRLLWREVSESPVKVHWFVLQTLWSILMGAVYNIVADATQTVVLTNCFYVASISLVFFTVTSRGSYTGIGNMPDVLTSVTVSSLTGLFITIASQLCHHTY